MEMKAHLTTLLWAALFAGPITNVAAQDSEETDDYVERRLTPPPIVHLAVTTPSAHSDFGQGTDCSNYILKPRRARFFLQHAQAISGSNYKDIYPWTECYARGTVTYANGMRAEWTIEIGGRGLLTPTNGKRKGVMYYLYCEQCEGFGKPPLR